ncbi:MAG: hypothetical protein NZM40_09805 [Sphingomonadaceae bacterium]|uniref:hypothetical protein n=1 Tax=Thermaurantiacus sp. TaxID=2820283 RepID=UPI00298ED9F8|nr:hypothetical protein [Thermaurantiacus sp.]MCS6987701.1 hypothetical protein [Sphingomonadaceae bacterium]MDW8415080.1 hypothetical protein [Thermaurantiacus sp.]
MPSAPAFPIRPFESDWSLVLEPHVPLLRPDRPPPVPEALALAHPERPGGSKRRSTTWARLSPTCPRPLRPTSASSPDASQAS